MNTGRPEAGEYYADLYNRAMNELAALREELAEKEKVWTARFELLCEGAIRPIVLERNDAQQRLAAAEQRNATLESLIHRALFSEVNDGYVDRFAARDELKVLLKPTESGASMSSKIDGVPRELLERLQSQTELSNDWDEVQALLAAPVVERQEAVGIEGMPQYLILFDDTERPVETMFGEQIARKRYADISMSWNAHLFVKIDSNSRDAMFAKNNATVYTSPPELAELQAIISRLTADVETMRAKNNELNDTVERLKGGQGEAVAWFTEDHLTDKSATTYDVGVSVMWAVKGWPVTPLYTSQPAPVEVALPEREHVHSKTLPFRNPAIGDGYISGWNACLDKVKELNQ